MDPFAVLGVAPGASPEEILTAYRGLAKRWHPDHGGGADAALRMAQINAAYDMARTLSVRAIPLPGAEPEQEHAAADPTGAVKRARGAGAWLPEPVRRSLGRELVGALNEGEGVRIVTPAATWASPRAVLAATDRRLLWLLDDAVNHRVRSLAYSAIAGVEHGLRRPLRRRAFVRVQTRTGRRLSFADLEPGTAAAIARQVDGHGVAA